MTIPPKPIGRIRVTAKSLIRNNIYAFVYGDTGSGKTRLPTTLAAQKDASDVAYITPVAQGLVSLVTAGFDPPVTELPGQNEDPFEPCMDAIADYTRDKSIRVIVLDEVSVMSGRAVDFLSNGEGEKAMGFEGWQAMLANFRRIEGLAEAATRAGKSFIYTSWSAAPSMESTLAGISIKEKGRPYLQGKAQMWLPGNTDLLARITSAFVTERDPATNKAVKKFKAELQLHASEEYLAKTRWAFLPSPHPANLKLMLNTVRAKFADTSQPQPK
ncbi:AAA domain [Caudoviricetes sp.]|nr:AAA domain [Caudoviricetes sp.]